MPHSANPLIRLCRDSFVRDLQGVGYISNQLSKQDRVYDDVGGVFLSALSRSPRTLGDMVLSLAGKFKGVTQDELRMDVWQFVEDLEKDHFLITGDSLADLYKKEPRFRYGSELVNLNGTTRSFWNPDKEPDLTDSQSFLDAYFADSPRLLNLQIELTSNCNERCRHCYLPPQREGRVNGSELVRRVINEYAEMSGLSLTFSGGEPMLHPDLAEFLQLARKNDLCVALLSNATLLTDSLIDVLAGVGLNQVQISIYSLDPAEHDRITRLPGSLAKSLAAIEKLIKANIPIQIGCPVMRTNYRSYPKVLKWANDLGLKATTDFVMIARTDFTVDNLSERLDEVETRELITNLARYNESYRDSLGEKAEEASNPIPALRMPEKQVCEVGRGRLCLAATGKYYPCPSWQGMCVGDANTTSLLDVWGHSPQLAELRRVTWASYPKCSTCDDFEHCKMCMARNFNESGGDMFKINDHFCRVARIKREVAGVCKNGAVP